VAAVKGAVVGRIVVVTTVAVVVFARVDGTDRGMVVAASFARVEALLTLAASAARSSCWDFGGLDGQ
jgi:hypothetical protein